MKISKRASVASFLAAKGKAADLVICRLAVDGLKGVLERGGDMQPYPR